MRYMYTIYKDDGSDTGPTRVDTSTRIEEIKEKDVTWPFYVDVYDMLENKQKYTLRSLDDLEGYIVSLERAAAWKPGKEDPKLPLPDRNLKTAVAIKKPGISAIPPVAIYALGAAMQDGVNKYEKYNWRDAGATTSIFFDAMARHLFAWYSGETYASDSKVHHLAHLMAGCAIILDSELHKTLNDDRKASEIKQDVINTFMKLIKES